MGKGERTLSSKPRKAKSFNTRAWAIILFVFSFLLYSNTLSHGYVLDDSGVLKDNFVVKQGIKGIPLILSTPYRYGVSKFSDHLYRPLSLVMFAIEWQVAPENPAVNHFVNVLLFSLSCALLLIVLRKLFHGHHPLLPLFACLLFAAHPVHTEVVANIKSRDEIMSLFFLLLSLYWFIDYLGKGRVRHLVVSVTAYLFSIFSKEGVATFVLLFPLAGWYFTGSGVKRILAASSLFVIPVILFFFVKYAVWRHFQAPLEISLADNLLVAIPGFTDRLATAVLLLGKYLFILVVPYRLVSDYSYNQIPATGLNDPLVWISLLVCLAALACSVIFFRRKTMIVFSILFFLVTISIYSNIFFMIGSSFAERFLYLPSLGFCLFIAVVLVKLFRVPGAGDTHLNIRSLVVNNRFPWLIVLVILIFYSSRTIARNAEWKSEFSLFSADIRHSPNSCHMRYYWGNTLFDKAKELNDPESSRRLMAEAIRQFDTALMIYPDYIDCYIQQGLAFFKTGDYEKALDNFRFVIGLNPEDHVSFCNMGKICYKQGNYPKAIEMYRKSLALNPGYADGYFNLGSALATTNQVEDAIQSYKKCIALDPANAKACYYIGVLYSRINNPNEARMWFDTAYELDPRLRRSF